MKLKDFKKTELWNVADCVEYITPDGREIEFPSTEVNRRRFFNKEVLNIGMRTKQLIIVQITLQE